MKRVAFFLAIVLVFKNVAKLEAKVYTKCGLTKELLNNGFERSYVGNCILYYTSCVNKLHYEEVGCNESDAVEFTILRAYLHNLYIKRKGLCLELTLRVCLIESESAKNTSKVTEKADRSVSLGLFQINSKEWCKFGSNGGKCQMKCENLIDEDIRDDSICARKVQSDLGFRAWEGWVRSCYRRKLSIPPC